MTKEREFSPRTTPRSRYQGGEGVVCHFRTGRRNGANEGGPACVGQTQHADIRQQQQLQPQGTHFTRGAVALLARRPADRALEAGVAKAVGSRPGNQQLLIVTGQIPSNSPVSSSVYGFPPARAGSCPAATTGTVGTLTVLATLGGVEALETVVDQGVQVSSATRYTSPPSPPSPPSGPPFGMYFSRRKLTQPLPPSPASTRIWTSSTNFIGNRHLNSKNRYAITVIRALRARRIWPMRAVSAGSSACRFSSNSSEKQSPARLGASDPAVRNYSATMLTYLRFCGPLTSNCTLPFAVANRVVLAQTNVLTSVELGAALTNDDAASQPNCFAAETLHAQAFSFRIATVAG